MAIKYLCPHCFTIVLYWRFIDRHLPVLEGNGRMGLILANWKKRKTSEREAIVDWGDRGLEEVLEISE